MGQHRRLLIVAEALRGGLGGVVRDHSEWFEHQGWTVTVAAPQHEEVHALTSGYAEVEIPTSARQARAMAAAIRDVRRVIQAKHPDVIHCHGLRSFLITRLATTNAPFVTLHGTGNVTSDPAGYRLVRRLGLRVTPYLAAGAFNADRENRAGWTFMAHASPMLATLERRSFPDPTSVPTFLWLGRLSEPKRPDIFVDAIATAARTRPVRGVIAGDGPLSDAVIGRIARLGAPIEVIGHTENVVELIDRAWALVVLSGFEALTFSVQEAMWAGRTAIVSPLRSTRWLVGEAGLLAGDTQAVTTAILRLAVHDEAARRGAASADRIRQLIVPGAPWPDVESAYRKRLERSR